jgi:putative IMPACT (imprinted ancient) family translation regulator
MTAILIKIMSGLFGRVLFRNKTTSALTAVAVILIALFGWHKVDKSSAVRRAVMEYVADVELTAARAQIAEANRRAAIAQEATDRLDEKVQAAEGEAMRFEAEIEAYERETTISPDGLVSDDLFDRLRGN